MYMDIICPCFSRHNNKNFSFYFGKCGPCKVFANYTLALALQLRKKHGKPSVTVAVRTSRRHSTIQENRNSTIHRRKQQHRVVQCYRTITKTEYTILVLIFSCNLESLRYGTLRSTLPLISTVLYSQVYRVLAYFTTK
jgi:hypothetical protein